MEFLAATKDGLIIYDAAEIEECKDASGNYASGRCSDGRCMKVLATMPSPPNAFGHAWSDDGTLLASVCDEGVRIYDADDGYKMTCELEKVAPDVQGRVGGVRTMRFSPKNSFIVTFEKWDPQFPENVHVWALQGDRAGQRIKSLVLKGYTSGPLPGEIIVWTFDEQFCLELMPGKGVYVHDGALENLEDEDEDDDDKIVPEANAASFALSPAHQKGSCYISCYTPQASRVARLSLYHLSNPTKLVMEMNLPNKVKDCQMHWNFDGSALLGLASSDVDETGNSYFGSTFLYWLKPETKKKEEVCSAKDGLVQDLCWSPTANEFIAIVGMLPAAVNIYNGMTGRLEKKLGDSKRNTLKWNPFGRFAAVAGFGTLPGDLEFYDRVKDETLSSLRAALTVDCSWFADGRHFLAATVAPRMNEGNQVTLYTYSGDQLAHLAFKPDVVEGRHEDTGAGARTKTQAILFAARWRPFKNKYEDRPASPPRDGTKRTKGLSTQGPATTGGYSGATGAYRPRGSDGGGSVAAMMRGELSIPESATREFTQGQKEGWEARPPPPQLEEWEIRKMEREAKKLAEQKALEAKEAEKQAIRDLEKGEKDTKKKLKELKKQLEELEVLKDKDWDELTEEDEAILEGEVELREQIAQLEKK
eukprot:TRINITY_DN1019_c0_g1_i3.p1 TRINITY_DN1019_c0_g1~~TRINITY_DN1019_c0_g1_i3.p1  ORF type:complete len:646 (+),score=163.15 TRINITY_DN1019_c0_g1_i3:93-2030(+)